MHYDSIPNSFEPEIAVVHANLADISSNKVPSVECFLQT